jgi:HSP20 family molecular chaperone IbpA
VSAIKDVDKINSRQIETLKRGHAREVNRIEDAHQNHKADLKDLHNKEIVEIKNENVLQVDKEAQRKGKVLEQMTVQLDESKRLTDKKLQDLKSNVTDVKARENEKLLTERTRVNDDHELYLDELNHRYESQIQKVNSSGQQQVKDLSEMKAGEVSQKELEYNTRLNDQTQNFVGRFQTDTNKYKQLKDQQDLQFKKERLSTHTRQQVEVEKLTTSHGEALEVRDGEFRKGLKSQDQMFEKKYADTMKAHEENFGRLNERHEKVISKMKTDLSEKLTGTISRSDDPFYSFSHLDLKLTQFPDRVEVSVEVPEHAKGDIQLTTNNKEVIVNFNRRYDDVKKDGGVTSKLHKVETFTTRLATDLILNPKTVKSNYEDGVMTYVVSKA